MRRFVVGLLLFVSAAALLLSSTSLWARQNVIDTGGFIANAEAIIDQPQVQARLAAGTAERIVDSPKVQAVVDEATAGLPPILQRFRPTVADGIRSLITTGAGQLLAAQPFRPLARAALASAHQQLVNGQPVRFTLGQAKDRLSPDVKTGLAGQVLDLIPSNAGVTLIGPNDAPMLYLAVNLLKVAWWAAGLVAIVALAGALLLSHRRRRTLRAWSVTLSVLILLLLITLRVGHEVLLGQVRPVNRGAIGAVYEGIAASARSWTLWLLVFAVLVILVTSLLPLAIRGIRRGRAAAATAADNRSRAREAQAEAMTGAETPAGAEAAPALEPVEDPRVAGGPAWWTSTVAWFRALGSPEARSGAGGFVRAHLAAFRWGAIVLGAGILLLWQSPNLSVLVWIIGLVAIALAVVDWLTRQAPEPVEPGLDATAGTHPSDGAAERMPTLVTVPVPSNGHADPVAEPVLVGVGTAAAAAAEPVLPAAPSPAPPLEPAGGNGAPAPLAGSAATPATEHSERALRRGDTNVKFAQLRDLSLLHDSGVLSDAEFEAEKREILQA